MSKFGFGTPATGTTTTTFGFGNQKPAPAFSTVTPSFAATSAATGGLSFSTAISGTSTTPNFGFGSTAGTSTTSQASRPFGSGGTAITSVSSGLFSTPIVSAAPTGGLSFGTPAATTGLNFGTSVGTQPTNTLNFASLFGAAPVGGLFGAKPVNSAALTATTNIQGLGGVDVSANKLGLTQGSSSPTAAKENLIPNELTQTIENFKIFIKTQKSFTSDIARGSVRPLNRCAEDTASLMELLTTLAGSVQRDRSLADKLKQDTAKALQNAEIAQRTHDTPAGLQYENNAPLLFFMELADTFEQDLLLFRSQIESTEKHIHTMVTPKTLTPQELTMAMSKLHESLIAVAGKLQGVHAKVQHQKEQYLNLRKYVLKDSSNVFEDSKLNEKMSRISSGKINSGPTPFGPGNKSFLSSTNLNTSRPPNYGTANPLAWGNATSLQTASSISVGASAKPPATGLSFNTPSNLATSLSATDSNFSFQLQKPPTGNKRHKH
ncbi:nuclear pore complex protein Nup58 isoform X2 [Neodiprion pinetum]|uniref:Nuclear pore complex protein Nup58 isoform X2 n=1 Tax=Neodiprion lecontei TaxID=441921 RepID=A0ABM3GEY4_NEOLC|nr:nuclear pore complex protein Nup58-like isoform X2 [Neodiprion fabricii]XP_046487144.1 nuclear pore complex protein Nup58-like isoform X2 [Neodiprion pinetum]XP_046598835.1 nuclear pore complex protein Nup58 isoform X2 [Neodiprion lecontei]XP_046624075.1 nuclear pore complex protein Nup58-like isoform X2 [Neodiprion virginianus]